MYVLLTGAHSVAEIIPDENPVFPGVPIEERYAPDFVQKLLHVPDDTDMGLNWVYDPEAGSFSPPPELGPADPDEGEELPPGPAAPTLRERVEALEAENAALAAAIERGLSL